MPTEASSDSATELQSWLTLAGLDLHTDAWTGGADRASVEEGARLAALVAEEDRPADLLLAARFHLLVALRSSMSASGPAAGDAPQGQGARTAVRLLRRAGRMEPGSAEIAVRTAEAAQLGCATAGTLLRAHLAWIGYLAARRALDLDPHRPAAQAALGVFLLHLPDTLGGSVAEAAALLRRAAAAEPHRPDWTAWLARALTESGRADAARVLVDGLRSSLPAGHWHALESRILLGGAG